jgi:hypothetical protein
MPMSLISLFYRLMETDTNLHGCFGISSSFLAEGQFLNIVSPCNWHAARVPVLLQLIGNLLKLSSGCQWSIDRYILSAISLLLTNICTAFQLQQKPLFCKIYRLTVLHNKDGG